MDPTYKLRGTASIKFTLSAEYLKVDNRRYGDTICSREKANDERTRARERDDEYYAMDGNGRVRCIIK